MKQKEVIWTIVGALILSECILGVAAHGEGNENLAVARNSLLLWEFAPYCENGLEYLVLRNTGAVASLRDFAVSDGEGKIVFGDVEIPACSTLTIANNGSAFYQYFNRMPDFEIVNGKEITLKGIFKLANSNEELYLYAPDGTLVDSVGYGKDRPLAGWNGSLLKNPSMGTVYRRMTTKDTDSSNDWVATKIGRTMLPPVRFTDANVTAFVTPDSGLNVVLQRIENATREILFCTYTADSPEIVYALENASRKNVSVHVMVESSPAGGLSGAEKSMISKLSGFANLTCYGTPRHMRYSYLHAKYIVIDGKFAVVSTENYKVTSYTEQGLCGNRGWGVVVENEGFAQQLAAVFWQDAKTVYGDTGRLTTLAANCVGGKDLNRTLSNFTTKTTVANVTLVSAPDNALGYLLRCLAAAKECLVVEALDFPLCWGNTVNPFVEALVKLSEKGVKVRVLLDGSLSNSKGNRETAEYLNAVNANMSARIIDARGHGCRMLHTKGFVIDNAYVYLGSTNFCENSFMDNREVGVFVESKEIAGYFQDVFEFDWKEDVRKPAAYIGMPSKIVAGKTVRFDGSSSTDNGRIVSYRWDFNDDGIFEAGGPVVNYTFSKPGKYRVTLWVADAAGNENCTSREITVGAVEEVHAGENQTWLYLLIPVAIGIIAGWKLGGMEKRVQAFVNWLRCKL
ncbi:MAG: phospholipase D-like domain-containing protein [Thermoplasmata archaeon]|nr:phospholipase D-like domain-containing protein [Thermoplasmata archaeon]